MKHRILLLALVLAGGSAFAQSEIMSFLSFGFNARHETRGKTSYDYYYFFGFDGYSEALIYNDRWVEFGIGSMTFYPNGRIANGFPPYEYRRYTGQDNSAGYERMIPTQGYMGEEHILSNNGKLVYIAQTDARQPLMIADKIEHTAQSLTVYYTYNGISFRDRYYDIDRAQLLNLFLEGYVALIGEIHAMVNEGGYERGRLSEIIEPVFQRRTTRELAIFRNCLYAIKGMRFTTASWADFFNQYLPAYRAQYTNAEVTTMFNDNERWLLNLVIEQENRRSSRP